MGQKVVSAAESTAGKGESDVQGQRQSDQAASLNR